MTQHLTKSLIDLRGFGFASQGDSKLRFDHVKRGLDHRPLVIALHEPFGETVEMKHLPPECRWEGVIAETEREMQRVKERLAGHRAALRVFREWQKSGDPWPGTFRSKIEDLGQQ